MEYSILVARGTAECAKEHGGKNNWTQVSFVYYYYHCLGYIA